MKKMTLFAAAALLLGFTASAAAVSSVPDDGFDTILELSFGDEEDIQQALELDLCDEPQTPDSLEFSMTNELLGTKIAKVIVKKGVKKLKKSVKSNIAERSKRKAVKGTGSASRLFPRKGLGTVRIVTYNVGTFTKSGYNRTGMVANMLQEMKADAVGIQEVDSCAMRTGGVFQIREIADATGNWNYSFAPALDSYQGGAYGIGIISSNRLPVVDSWSMQLAKGKGAEQRALDVVEFKKFVFATTHLDHKSDAAQLEQARTVSNALMSRYAGSHKVVILCGDFNALPTSKTIKEMKKNWTLVSSQGKTYPSKNASKCIDYIMVLDNGSSYNLKHSFVAREFEDGKVSEASDHLPVWIDIKPKR